MHAGRAGRARQAGMLRARGRGVQAAWALGRWAARARARGAGCHIIERDSQKFPEPS